MDVHLFSRGRFVVCGREVLVEDGGVVMLTIDDRYIDRNSPRWYRLGLRRLPLTARVAGPGGQAGEAG